MSQPSDWLRDGCTQCHQACNGRTNCLSLASDHHSRARDAGKILFQPKFVMTMSVRHFAKLITVKKSHDIVTDKAMVAKMSLITLIVLSFTSDYHNWVRDADMDFASVRFFMTLTVTFCSTEHTSHVVNWNISIQAVKITFELFMLKTNVLMFCFSINQIASLIAQGKLDFFSLEFGYPLWNMLEWRMMQHVVGNVE